MHRITLVMFVLVGVLGVSAQEPYFPKGAFSGDTSSDQFTVEWYSKQLKALEEPSLLSLAKQTTYESYRFLWLRTFHHPISVRLDIRADGIGELTVKMANGAGGYKPGHLIQNISRPLTKRQTDKFLAMVRRVKFWEIPTNEDSMAGNDGSQWIIEGVKDGKYHVVDRWTPREGAVRELGLALALGLADLNIPKNELY